MNLKRFGVPAVIAVTAAIALSSCASNEGGATADESTSTLAGNLDETIALAPPSMAGFKMGISFHTLLVA